MCLRNIAQYQGVCVGARRGDITLGLVAIRNPTGQKGFNITGVAHHPHRIE